METKILNDAKSIAAFDAQTVIDKARLYPYLKEQLAAAEVKHAELEKRIAEAEKQLAEATKAVTDQPIRKPSMEIPMSGTFYYNDLKEYHGIFK